MALSVLRNLALVGLGAVLGAGWSAFAASSQYVHAGRVVEHETGRRLKASVVAWPEMKRTDLNGSCPAYGSKALDIETSVEGEFQVVIDKSQHTYTVVYCLNDFVPRVDPMPNRRNGTFVEPTPAELWPVKIDPSMDESFDIEVGRTAIALLNDLKYLMTVDEDRFAESINRLATDFSEGSGSQAETIRSIRTLVSNWKNEGAK